ncbi:cadherin-related family member 5 [Stegastes partitus]|uniref:Cadherin-related family member 5 n=1 Tax=Stegastes partitus TaxID=144197 RepID=A0A9Y4JI42_9TELE|nr:PREDICTED: cadherin-related family member 5-like [Stegastes partitus]
MTNITDLVQPEFAFEGVESKLYLSGSVEYFSQLRAANDAYAQDGTVMMIISNGVKSEILDRLVDIISKITAYPNKDHYESVAKALVSMHLCLREPGSGKRVEEKCKPVKKSKKGEIHYVPEPPEGQTTVKSEKDRETMVLELCAEFSRIVTKDLLESFLEGLDLMVPSLFEADEDVEVESFLTQIRHLNAPWSVSGNSADALLEARLRQLLSTGLDRRRQLGDIEFSNRYAEFLRSKAKHSSVCAFLRRMQVCSAPSSLVNFPENNNVGDVVATITVQSGVTLEFSPPPENPENPFRLEGNQLVAERMLDFETTQLYEVAITCTETATALKLEIVIVVLLTNENDNPPFFDSASYQANVDELSPVGEIVGNYPAKDLDAHPQLSYTLTSASNDFVLRSSTNPEILVNARLDYDKVKNVELILTAKVIAGDEVHTATTTIIVTIVDVDNRPPWFQPCTEVEVDGNVICHSAGYTGSVTLNEQETGVLPLKPGPLHAIDGDTGINEKITYSFLSGNEDNLFEINQNTGGITMLKPTDVLGTISLSVLAAQAINSHQFATTTVTISVQVKSLHPPKFQKPRYEGVATSIGTMVMDVMNKDQPLQILVTDEDYAATGGVNPHITYVIIGSHDFIFFNGYLFMTTDLPESTLTLQVSAIDTTNDESDTSQLLVEVKSGLTTSLPTSTTDFMTMTPNGESTTGRSTTNNIESNTTPLTDSTTDSKTTNSNGPTTDPVTVPSGGNDVVGMAVLGAVLGVLLFVCLVVIGMLVCRLQKGKADWKKIYEASMFRSSLGQGSGGHKEGIQYTNEAFQNDEDGSSLGSGSPDGGSVKYAKELPQTTWSIPREEAIVRSTAPLHDLLPDDSSDTASEGADSEKDVKPILTKERRVEEGYKSVWFKEDIDPNAKEEVVIIPDSREDDSEEEDEEPSRSNREDDEDDNQPTKKIAFADSDLDSEIRVKNEDRQGDSDSDDSMNLAL